MQFQRLRLSGFKSFVDAAEFKIEPGLTGVVGPNGCGKSNLLEALRWVMGATSAKAMRGEGMDDVIFGGAEGRAARNHAEVLLQIDNAARTAPAQFNQHPILEVTRRIDRGSGSTYRVNGVETRARDVQLLFADASTGANSPSLVRQGQISELIAAKPANRRRILEEAAGVSGLHSRRHEADLKLRGAQANLDRLEDVAGELEAVYARLKREARQAEKYRRVSHEIRTLQSAALFARWRDARNGLDEAQAEAAAAAAAVEAATREAARATVASEAATAALPAARQDAALASALHQRLAIERDRAEQEEARARAELQRLVEDQRRLRQDRDREGQIAEDAKDMLGRIDADLTSVRDALAAAPDRTPELQRALSRAADAREHADRAVEQAAAAAAADQVRRQGAQEALHEAEARRRAAVSRADAAKARLVRLEAEAISVAAALRALPEPSGEVEAAQRAQAAAEHLLAQGREALETAEARRAAAEIEERRCRDLRRGLDDHAARLSAEIEGLRRLQPADRGSAEPVLHSIRAEDDLETALAAALGDDLEAALDPSAARHWAGADAEPPRWPKGAEAITGRVKGPGAMAARLAYVALVDQEDGERLQKVAPIGARLVSRAGDLWRWDGFTMKAGASNAAAARLAQRRRLEALEASLADGAAALAEARRDETAAQITLRQADEAVKARRGQTPALEQTVATARAAIDRSRRLEAQRLTDRALLDDHKARLEAERPDALERVEEARRELAVAEAAAAALRMRTEIAEPSPQAPLAEARDAAARTRAAEAAARNALDQDARSGQSRRRRLDALAADRAEWTARFEAAEERLRRLGDSDTALKHALSAAEEAPQTVAARKLRLLEEGAVLDRRRSEALVRLQEAEDAGRGAERQLRAAEAAAAAARERRAASDARAAAAGERLIHAADQVRAVSREEPERLGEALRAQAVAIPTDAEGVEAHLARLERDRDMLGAVNLRAEDDALETAARLRELGAERQDLRGAVERLRAAIDALNAEGRERLQDAFGKINESFKSLFETLFQGGQAELRLVESTDPLDAGLEIYACPPGKRLAAMSLMSGGEQALTAAALIFAVFLANPSPVCVLDEVDAPLDDANVDRFCRLLDEMRRRTETRFIVITHNPVTMSRVDRLYGVTMPERGISELVSVDLRQAEAIAAE